MLVAIFAPKQLKLKVLYCSHRSYYNQFRPIKPIIFFRSMFKLARQTGINMRIIRPIVYNQLQSREMACYHGSKLRNGIKRPLVKHTDLSGKHNVITETTCSAQDCKTVNCADPNVSNQINPCGRSVVQNQTSPGRTQDGFITKIVGNTTKNIPSGVPGREIDPNITYNGTQVLQYMVEEKPPVNIDDKDLKFDIQVSKYLQQHHDDITK